MDRQYWDLELKNQSKKRMQLVNAAIAQFDAIVHDRYGEKYFSGKQSWRNPLHLRISLPKGKKYDFILAAKLKCWLFEPPRCNFEFNREPKLKLKGNHDESRKIKVRNYRIHPIHAAYVWDVRSGIILEGAESVKRVLDGELDLVRG